MRRLSALALAATVVGGCSGPQPVLSGYQPQRVIGARDVGAADRDRQIDLVITLQLRDREGLDRLLRQQSDPGSSRFRQYLQPVEFGAQFGPSPDEYERVAAWAEAAGLTVTRREPSRTSISVRGRVADVERAFGTSLRTFEDARGRFRAPDTSFRKPDGIADLFASVIGLDDAQWRSHLAPGQLPPAPVDPQTGKTGSRGPGDLRSQYNAAATGLLGDGETVAILGTGFPPDPASDVDNFLKKTRLGTNSDGSVDTASPLLSDVAKRTAQYAQVFIGGPNRDEEAFAENEYYENVLDIDCVLGVAPRANVVHVMTAENGGGLFFDGISYIINNVPQAHAVTVSYGLCERYLASEVLLQNSQFQQAKAQGQTWFFAAGDDGTDGCSDGSGNKVLSVGWPASSPYTVGVGGTNITVGNSAAYPFAETAWSGGGGGQSELIDKPAYQVGVGPYADDGVRHVPDISAIAGNPGVLVYVGTQGTALQGTSAAAPIVAALWALLDQSQGGTGITNFHERIYELGQLQAAGQLAAPVFHDVTSGKNAGPGTQGFSAQAGYDLATGWGTPNLQNLINQW